MSYNTITNFKLFAFPSGSFNSIPDVVIQNALDVGSSQINAALRRHHKLPLNTATYISSSELALIYNAERVIATYNLMLWRGFRPSVDNTQDVVLVNQYESVVGKDGLLDKLLQGQIIFPQDADATPSVSENVSKVVGKPIRTIKNFDDDDNEYINF